MPSRPLNENEMRLIEAELPSLRDQTLFVLGVKTGFRISELLSLSVKDVESCGVIQDTVTVKRSNMKGKQVSRSVPLHSEAKELLLRYITQCRPMGLLFPIGRKHAWRVLKRATRTLQLPGKISPHSMRKTFGMKVYKRTGNNIVAAQKALGHKSLSSTTHYLSVDQDTVDSAILS